MDDRLTILPPPPPAPTMAWAAAKSLAFRAIGAMMRLGRAMKRRAESIAGPCEEASVPPEDRRLSWFVDQIVRERAQHPVCRGVDDRATAIEVRRV